jgi:hypothetical protein
MAWRAHRNRRLHLGGIVVLLVLAALAVAVATRGGDSSSAPAPVVAAGFPAAVPGVSAAVAAPARGGRIATASLATFHRAIAARMRAEHLSTRWIICLHSGKHFHGVPVVRCNVDFGEPHIVAYCSVLRGGRLLTSEDDPAIPCSHDDRGYAGTITVYTPRS